jgi:allantoinase
MAVRVLLRAPRLVTPDGEISGAVLVEGEHISAVLDFDADVADAEVIELTSEQVLLPGLIDSHVHVNEPGRTEWEGFATATRAAAKGGVTTLVDMPLNSIPATVDVAALETKRKSAEGQLSVDVAFWGGAIPGNAGELAAMHEAGAVGFKCFLLDSGVPEFPALDPGGLALAMSAIAEFGGLLIAHAEDPDVIDSAPHVHSPKYADFVASRPPLAEVRAIETLLAETRRTGCRTHIVHVSAAETLPLIRAAKDEGLPLTAETCPHYLTLLAEDVEDGATQFKCCPPIRNEANRDALWAALLDGTLDMIVSDHSPCIAELKRFDSGDFAEAWGGIASVQLGLATIWTEARQRGIGFDRIAHWMAAAPAKLVGLTDRGVIAAGKRADFAVGAPDADFVVDPAKLEHRNPITPYAGQQLFGVVEQTWLAGRPLQPGELRGQMVAT